MVDNYPSSEYKIQLNEGQVDVTLNDVCVDNLSEIPSPTPAPYYTPINDKQSNSSFPIENPYYEMNEFVQKPQLIQPIIQQKNCSTRCYERYDDKNIYLIRIFLIGTLYFTTNAIVCCLCYGVLYMKGS